MFKQGELLKKIVVNETTFIQVGTHCDKIIVEMENGQMAEVPWFEVWNDGKVSSRWNAALCLAAIYKGE